MQPVTLASEINNTPGALGYSCLRLGWNGQAERITVLYLRDQDGFTQHCLIGPAAAMREAF